MNSTPMILLAVGLATGASVATTYALRPSAPVIASEGAEGLVELGQLRAELSVLRKELGELRSSNSSPGLPLAAASQRVAADEIDRAVRRYLSELGGAEALATPGAVDKGLAAKSDMPDMGTLLAQLGESGLNDGRRHEIWKQLREAGMLDEAIAQFEVLAKANLNDPDAQVEVAQAYLQKVFEVGDGPEAGIWAGKADAAYDRALELNPQHWGARFNKAVSLSFWPPIFGKQAEAITHFETLIGQQAEGQHEAGHSQSYLLLGNLYNQTGQADKAKAIWAQGLAAFPGDASLAGKLGN